jgi:Tfp pilus assembly protein PilN
LIHRLLLTLGLLLIASHQSFILAVTLASLLGACLDTTPPDPCAAFESELATERSWAGAGKVAQYEEDLDRTSRLTGVLDSLVSGQARGGLLLGWMEEPARKPAWRFESLTESNGLLSLTGRGSAAAIEQLVARLDALPQFQAVRLQGATTGSQEQRFELEAELLVPRPAGSASESATPSDETRPAETPKTGCPALDESRALRSDLELRLPALKAQIDEQNDHLRQLVRRVPDEWWITNVERHLRFWSERLGTPLADFVPGQERPVAPGSFLAVLPIQVELSGELSSLRKLLVKLGKSNRLLQVHQIQLTGGKSGRAQLSAELRIYRFRSLEELEAER